MGKLKIQPDWRCDVMCGVLTPSTKRMIIDLIEDVASSKDKRDIVDACTKGPSKAPQRPPRSGSGNVQVSGAPVSKEKPEEYLGDWKESEPGYDNSDDDMHYRPSKKTYVDDDFEQARKNRQHIDRVMKDMF